MPLATGTRLGPYEVVAPLGAGGMGEVYRARDTRLGRDVAVKVLPQHLSTWPEVRSRFEREARAVSSLNHPHICTLHDVGREGDTDYLVMELVDGETLAKRLARGPLPLSEVLRIGAQIADALDRAHRAGVIHRDLKPGNVMLTRAGAKLMDFGLARATGLAGPPGSGVSVAMTQSPTMAQPLTAEGTIVGTFQYMAPEQLEGKEADVRSDLWSLGCVLYEMATGKRAFEGRSQASLISSIMSGEPAPIAQIAPMAPPALDRLVRACLAKEPDDRIQTAHDVKLQLQWIAEGVTSSGAAPVVRARRRGAWIAGIVLSALGLAVAAWIGWMLHPAPPAHPLRVSIFSPEDVNIAEDELDTAISPDGRSVAFVAADSSRSSQLWVRELDATDARPLPGTQQATLPFWSPDSRSIAFFAEGKLKKVSADGKAVQNVCNALDGRGGTWNRNGVILFTPVSNGGLFKVSEGGGPVTPVLAPETARNEKALRFPCFLPDGRHFLYCVLSGSDSTPVRMGSLDSPRTSWVLNADGGALYAAPGHLLFAQDRTLIVQPFDLRRGRLTGRPHVLGPAPGASQYAGSPPASVSAAGSIAQRSRAPINAGLTWLDREGRRIGSVPTPSAAYLQSSLSPDQRSIALIRLSPESGGDVWTIEAATGRASRLTFGQRSAEKPQWSPDGAWVAYSALTGMHRNLFRKLANGAGEPEELLEGTTAFGDPTSWSSDGRVLLFRDLSPTTGEDVWALALDGSRKRTPLFQSPYHEEDGELSPDGRWVCYRSNESGRTELYVQSFPRASAKLRVSDDGAGTQPRTLLGRGHWRADGREVVYVSGDGVTVMAASFQTSPRLEAGTPRTLFHLPAGCLDFVPAADHRRFLMVELRGTKESGSIQLIVDWPAEVATR